MQHIGRIEPVEVVADVARRWRGRVPMAIASGSLREVVCQTIAQLGMSDWFDPVLGAEDSVLSKPAPDIFLLAARKMGVAPARCLVYEDSDKGLLAARAAGMHGVDVRPWHTPQVTPILG
jgi:beta-phosphoglucomutase-like phosphatase (HAD superfamily)